jgi:hypothetical protein
VRIDLNNESLSIHISPELLAAVEAVEALVLAAVGVYGGVLVHDIQERETVSLTYNHNIQYTE